MSPIEPQLCHECGEQLTLVEPSPEEYTDHTFCFRVPFTSLKLMLFKDDRDLSCENCLTQKSIDSQNDLERRIYDQGVQDGIDRALDRS